MPYFVSFIAQGKKSRGLHVMSGIVGIGPQINLVVPNTDYKNQDAFDFLPFLAHFYSGSGLLNSEPLYQQSMNMEPPYTRVHRTFYTPVPLS